MLGEMSAAFSGKNVPEYEVEKKEDFEAARFEKIRQYVQDNLEAVSSIADRLGFSSVQHFNTFFKQREGYSPVVFRKSCGSKHVR